MHISSERLITALRAEGFRITDARRAICQVLATSHEEHLSAADIHEKAGANGRLDRSTVYRTLDALEAASVLTHTHLGHGSSVYHLSDEARHQHLVCDSCGNTFAIPEQDLAELLANVKRKTGFTADPSHFAVGGTCSACAV